MTDPKPAPAGSPGEEPAAPTPGLNSQQGADAYQFPTRKARRIAEMTGVIPIVVPEKPVLGKPSAAKAEPKKSRSAKAALAKASAAEQAPEKASPAQSGAVPPAAGQVTAESNVFGSASRPHLHATSRDEATPRPVSAASVAHLPAVPKPPVPIVPVPASVANPVSRRVPKPPRTPKAGRDLPAAIGVGITLLVVVLGSLLFFPLAFVVVATAFTCVGVWEVARAIGTRGIRVPLTPVMIGTLAMPASAYFAGTEGLLFALVASAGATLLWRSLDPEPGAVKSILAGIFALMWIPFLLSFVLLMMQGVRPPTTGLTLDFAHVNPGVIEVVIMLMLVVANDTFGYLFGVLFGKHPMAPQISPKKSWEGFAGSLLGAMVVAIAATVFFLDVHWWVGFVLAIGMVLAGTGGDFAESMVKRELGVKDMSNLLPGHGGVMDRLDSILFAAPVAYATFSVLGRL